MSRNVGSTRVDEISRYRLARWIIGLAGVLLISVLAGQLFGPKDPETIKGLSDYITGLLPLIGAWVGALVAYYFSQEQQRESERTLRELLSLDGRLRTVPITSWMILPENVVSLSWCEDLEKLPVKSIIDKMNEGRVNRLPILDGAGRILAVVHRSVVEHYLVNRFLKPGETIPQSLELGDYSDLKCFLPRQTHVILSEKATMANARNALLGCSDAADIIVTAHGRRDEPVSGWLTNTLIMEAARL